MIAEMILMNQLTCADRRTALLGGGGVQDKRTTGVFRNGYSATAKTIAETDRTNYLRTVPHAMRKLTSLATTSAAYRSNGSVTSLMTVEMEVTNRRLYANISTESVLNQNSSVVTESVSHRDGAVTMRMTVETIPMRLTAAASSARTEPSSVNLGTVLPRTSDVMATEIVETYRMRLDVHRGILVADTVLRADSSARTTYAFPSRICAMVLMTVEMAPMKRRLYAPTSTATR